MKNNYWMLGLTLIHLLGALTVSAKEMAIVVDYQPFVSAEQAARMEKEIDWTGKDVAAMTACTESFAAQELLHHLQAAANGSVLLSIHMLEQKIPRGSIVLANLSTIHVKKIIQKYDLDQRLGADESFAIIPEHDRLYIIGSDRVGTLYGVYCYLETLGFRWFAPGQDGTMMPRLQDITLPAGPIIESPKFITRGFWAWEDRGNLDFYFWMARNRLNFWTIAEPNHALLKKIGIKLTAGGHLHFDRFLNPGEEYPFDHQRFQGDENKPADPYPADSDEYQGDANGDRMLSYFEAHPEWYGLVAGKRETLQGDFGTNICTSNPYGVAELCRKLVNDLASGEWKEVNSLNFWPLDVGKWCECMDCQALGTFTDRMLLLTHQVQQAIATATSMGKINRQIHVIFPIYYETLAPPSRPLPPDFDYDHCIGTVFPIQRCYVHGLDDTTCTEYNTTLWSDFAGWIHQEPRYYQGQYFMGEYYNVSSIKSLPVIYPSIMAHDLPLYYRNGIRHCHYMHACTRFLGPKRLNNYLFAKLLWNPDVDVHRILDNYFSDFYGPAKEPMKQLYAKLEYGLSNVKQLKHHRSLANQMNRGDSLLFPYDHFQLRETHPLKNDGVDLEESVLALQECRRIMDDLLRQQWDDRLARIVNEDDRHLRYAENTVLLYYHVVRAMLAKDNGDIEGAKSFFRQTIPIVQALKAEKEIVQTASSHANAADGFEASLIQQVYQRLATELKMIE